MSELKKSRASSLVNKSISHFNIKKAKRELFEMNEEDLFVGSPYSYDLVKQKKESSSSKKNSSERFKKRFGI